MWHVVTKRQNEIRIFSASVRLIGQLANEFHRRLRNLMFDNAPKKWNEK